MTILNSSYFHSAELVMNAGMGLAVKAFVFEFDNTIFDFVEE